MLLDSPIDLLLAWLAYFVITISPGPANVAIAATSMGHGRYAGLSMAAGVLVGSQFWGILAALGLSTMLSHYGAIVDYIKLIGGLYLLWLASSALRSSLSSNSELTGVAVQARSNGEQFARGLAIHLTNPKAILGWMAIIAIGTSNNSSFFTLFLITTGCLLLGVLVFAGYALLFSTRPVTKAYGAFKRWIDSATALVFGLSGLKLLFWQNS